MITKTEETPINILLVDDEPRNLMVLESILDCPDYHLTKAQSGQEALIALLTRDFALLVLDIEMPGMNGWELAQIIKKRKKTEHIPIIFLTAHYAEDEHVLQGYTAGAVDYLTKPVNSAILRSKVAVFVHLCRKAALEESNRALRESEERARAVLNSALSAVVVIDSEGRITEWNAQAERMFERTRLEALGQKLSETIIPPRYREAHRRGLEHFLATGEGPVVNRLVELSALRRDGSEFPVELSISPLRAGNVVTFCGFITDITQRKQAEQQIKASLQEKEVLLKEIHHRVKNNLQVICSLLNLQSGYIRDAEALALFRESESRIRSMAMIHEKLYQNESLSRVDFAEYLASFSSLLFTTYVSNPTAVRLATRLDPVFLDIDTAVPLGLIVNELVSNSLKYAYPEGRSGIVELTLRAGPDDQYTLSVRDQGVGLPTGFDVNKTGTLGLHLVNILSAQLGAALSVESNGDGTVFELTSKINPKPEAPLKSHRNSL
jgi:two-component system, sensor histidine kinase PdtaS